MAVVLIPSIAAAVIGFIIMLITDRPNSSPTVREFGKALMWSGVAITVWILSTTKGLL